MKSCVVPSAIDGFVGVTAIDTSAALVTVRFVLPLIAESVAVTVAPPIPVLVARPWLPAAFETVAIRSSEEAHVTCVVRSCVEASVNVPVATNGFVVPRAIEGFVGVTAIETSAALVTVRVVLPLIPETVAETFEVPIPAPVARPFWPATFDTVATSVSVEAQVAWVVRSFVVWSEYVPVARNGCVVPFAIDGFVGVTAIETSLAIEWCDLEPQPESSASAAIPHVTSDRRTRAMPDWERRVDALEREIGCMAGAM